MFAVNLYETILLLRTGFNSRFGNDFKFFISLARLIFGNTDILFSLLTTESLGLRRSCIYLFLILVSPEVLLVILDAIKEECIS